ncbi:translation initiation factor IF-2 N-terminal domain-containing protein [Rathayibacter festucae]|uniref:translation initiation factor IF-2 N-terminal domain-containing protein n=1 Tax=Rathayibacter festucae TaxID=110937 RepID=UPI002A6B6AB6|nr:translation initiation factor IF-2 N-terminal domain-containing protein [Rathayibacter festucae]MDY0914483.1 hypothetical protein [Rathayibacter festucae]
MKIRVHELAVELKLPSLQVVLLLHDIGIHVKGPSSSLDDADEATARRLLPAKAARSQWSADPTTKKRPLTEYQLYERSGFATYSEWCAAREVAQATYQSRQAAAAQSSEIYEAARNARREADRARWSDPFDRPSTTPRSKQLPFVHGGAPGLGKRR